MNLTEIMMSLAMTAMTAFVGLAVQSLKRYLLAKGGKKAVEILEILAKNAVHAVEQVAEKEGIKGAEKLTKAKLSVIEELGKYNVYVTDEQLTVFIEAAVNQMNQAWGW